LEGQQLDQLTAVVFGLWQQLGLAPEALPAFAAAIDLEPRSLTADPKVIEYTAACALVSLQHIVGLDTAQLLWRVSSDAAYDGVTYDQLSRQLQQLLSCVIWRLPQLLLQVALLANAFEAAFLHVATLVDAALASVHAWRMPGLLSAASRASPSHSSTAAGYRADVLTEASCTELLPALHGTWLCVLHSVLLQPYHGLLYTAAAAETRVVSTQTCACRQALSAHTAQSFDDTGFTPWSTFEAKCNRLDAVTSLLRLTHELAAVAGPGMPPGSTLLSSPVWFQRAPALLLLLKARTRGVLPHHVLCSS
jgi:hypothetical protein